MATNEFTIFYAWQSDTPANANRYLIEESIKEGCAIIGARASYPYAVTITSDTKGVPGLCDIPKEILKKIRAADAVVLDLTFIAKTAATPTKYCPNPNVLFELGYAFRSIGAKRLVCVMNEAHGPIAGTLFDIAHRRHPVKYRYPSKGVSRNQAVSKLAKSLADALEPTIQLGPRSAAVDSNAEFERERLEIESIWRNRGEKRSNEPVVFFHLHPRRYSKRRWPNSPAVQATVRKYQVMVGRHECPPSVRGTNQMPWGIYNDLYERPAWAFTYSGQFWAALPIGAWSEHAVSARERRTSGVADDASTIPSGRWVDYAYALSDISALFRFAGSVAGAYLPAEQLVWSARCEQLTGTRLASSDLSLWLDLSETTISPGADNGGVVSAVDLQTKWAEMCADFAHELFGMFETHGRPIQRENILARVTTYDRPY